MEFAAEFPEEFKLWKEKSNYIVVLAVRDEPTLVALAEKLETGELRVARSVEIDIGDELTAIAIVPDDRARKLLSNIPLAGKRIDEDAERLLKEKLLKYKS